LLEGVPLNTVVLLVHPLEFGFEVLLVFPKCCCCSKLLLGMPNLNCSIN